MDDDTEAAVLAHMAYRIVESRRRDLRETIAVRFFRQNGTVTAAEVDEAFAAEWIEPAPHEIADLVARKAAASVDWHHAEAGRLEASTAAQADKAAKLREQADEVEAANAAVLANADQVRAGADVAQALLDAAEAAGGNAVRAPGGVDAAVRAQVAEALGEGGQV